MFESTAHKTHDCDLVFEDLTDCFVCEAHWHASKHLTVTMNRVIAIIAPKSGAAKSSTKENGRFLCFIGPAFQKGQLIARFM